MGDGGGTAATDPTATGQAMRGTAEGCTEMPCEEIIRTILASSEPAAENPYGVRCYLVEQVILRTLLEVEIRSSIFPLSLCECRRTSN